MQQGWIKLHRRLLNWEWYGDTNMVRLFIHLLLTANPEPKRWQGTTIGKGQRFASMEQLRQETGLSTRELRTCIAKLVKSGEITTEPTSRGTTITIRNYDTYQQADSTQNGKRNGKQKPATTTYKSSDCDEERQTSDKRATNGETNGETSQATNERQTEQVKNQKVTAKSKSGETNEATNGETSQATTTKEDKNNNILVDADNADAHAQGWPGTVEEEVEALRLAPIWMEQMRMRHKLTQEQLEAYLGEFANDCRCRGTEHHESEAQAKRHFNDWLRIQIQKNDSNGRDNHTGTRKDGQQAKQERFAEYADVAARFLARSEADGGAVR